ncbi:hypothetical protein ACN23B_11920 [Anabaena sp. FACHB-709]|nr:hypothetical protein [Nostoc sp. PCC 7120 = FACHB-418]
MTQIEELAEALLNFSISRDLANYLAKIPQSPANS